MIKTCLTVCLLVCALLPQLFAQDERSWRRLLDKARPVPPPIRHFDYSFQGDFYRIDLNGDGQNELISWARKDGLDFLRLQMHAKAAQEFQLTPQGQGARIQKIKLVALSDQINLALVYYYQGKTQGHQNEAEVRLYFLTWEQKNLDKLYWQKGPVVWMDQEQRRGFYWKRPTDLEVVDLNKDGIREVKVSHLKLSRVYFYSGGGKWSALGDPLF